MTPCTTATFFSHLFQVTGPPKWFAVLKGLTKDCPYTDYYEHTGITPGHQQKPSWKTSSETRSSITKRLVSWLRWVTTLPSTPAAQRMVAERSVIAPAPFTRGCSVMRRCYRPDVKEVYGIQGKTLSSVIFRDKAF